MSNTKLGNDDNLNILINASKFIKENKRFAIATVVSTWGSSPRPISSQMIVTENSEIIGSVSGGCIENSVIEESIEIINGASPKILCFGVSNERAWEMGLTCGGKVSVYLESDNLLANHFDSMINAINKREKFSIFKNLIKHKNYLYFEKNKETIEPDIKKIISKFKSQNIENGMSKDNQWFAKIYMPKPKIVIVGAVHIAQHLEKLCNLCGFSIDIIDPRETFASKERFKIGKLINKWPDEYFKENQIDNNTAIVTLTHDPKLDDPALFLALKSKAFYIGSLGSKKTHAARLSRLKKHGFSKIEVEKINGPIGLNISAKSPAEIAISIISQIIQIQNNK